MKYLLDSYLARTPLNSPYRSWRLRIAHVVAPGRLLTEGKPVRWHPPAAQHAMCYMGPVMAMAVSSACGNPATSQFFNGLFCLTKDSFKLT